MKRLVHGVGFNDGRHKTREIINGEIIHCPFYLKWSNMLGRCYCASYQKIKPNYRGCTVADEWLVFSVFREWMQGQDWEGKFLDKDMLFAGNKIYSPSTCVFISNQTNTFLNEATATRGDCLLGVHIEKGQSKFRALITVNNKARHLGYFDTESQAHNAWRVAKADAVMSVAFTENDLRVKQVLIAKAVELQELVA